MKTIQIACVSLTICIFLLLANTGLTVAQQSTTRDYIIGAGDVLQIEVWDHPDLNRTVEVAQDGTFTFPFIGKVQASGKSVFIVETLLVQKLSDGYIVGPQVTVGVAEYKNKKVFLFGEVIRPGSYVLKQDMRLLELISSAGGFTDDRGTICTIVRAPESGQDAHPVPIENATGYEIIKIDLAQLTAGNSKENILVMPNDSIYISTAEQIFVTGEVRRPGEIEYIENMTVRQAISMAGGGTPKAAIGRTRIIRVDNGREREIKPDLVDSVLPNDIIKVPESFF
jgi:polysaccharide export outer membrane protein